jgi:hypothetical protein
MNLLCYFFLLLFGVSKVFFFFKKDKIHTEMNSFSAIF